MAVIQHVLTATSPSSASTAASTATIGSLDQHDALFVLATIQGATGGTLDIYVQTLIHPDGSDTGVWVDIIHFAQFSAGAAAITRAFTLTRGAQNTTITAVGTDTSPALAANTVLGGEWGDRWRFVFVAGASTSAGAAQTLRVFGARKTLR